MDDNKIWMSKGKVGCSFAALFAKNPLLVGWKTIINPEKFQIPVDTFILSLQFPESNIFKVREWALNNGFFIEDIEDKYEGLRYKINNTISWVQYFGPDSHVVTRQAPIPELMMCVKLPKVYYAKVGFKGILHLAHTSISNLSNKVVDTLWDSSFTNTEKRLGRKPTIEHAAKTTFKK